MKRRSVWVVEWGGTITRPHSMGWFPNSGWPERKRAWRELREMKVAHKDQLFRVVRYDASK